MRRIVRIVWIAAAIVMAGKALEPQEYMRMQVELLSLSLEESQQVLACLDSGECSPQKKISIEERYEKKRTVLLRSYGFASGAEAAAYYSGHRRELEPLFLEGEYAKRLKTLREQIEALHRRAQTREEGQ